MSKTVTGKRVTFKVELYWRGKRKTPSVGIQYEGKNYPGLPKNIKDTQFNKGAHQLCAQLVAAGELD
jgi:hypothetical protein